MSFQSSLVFPVKKRSETFQNKVFSSPKLNISVKRALFGEVPSPKKSRLQENSNENTLRMKTKQTQNASASLAKQLFHIGQPSRIVGRAKEISEIENFLSKHITHRLPSSMYVSGAPGTGKTSCLMSVIETWEKDVSFAFVNCTSVRNPNDIYTAVAQKFGLPPKFMRCKNIVKSLEKYIVTSTSMNVLVLDEIDTLDSRGQEVLYSLFEWPQLPRSSLILIGVSNTLDLIDRLLPRLQTFGCKPTLMHFQPYTREQIIEILEDRLSESEHLVIRPVALQMCARKIAACTGDIRAALNVCCRAVERVQGERLVLKATSDDRRNPGSPMKGMACADLPDIVSVLNEVYGSRLQQTTNPSKIVTMPLQLKVVVCTLVLMKGHFKSQDLTVGKLYDTYKRVCKKRNIDSMDGQFKSICDSIETMGLVVLKPAKAFRLTKVISKIDSSEAEYLLQDKALLQSILQDKSVLSKS